MDDVVQHHITWTRHIKLHTTTQNKPDNKKKRSIQDHRIRHTQDTQSKHTCTQAQTSREKAAPLTPHNTSETNHTNTKEHTHTKKTITTHQTTQNTSETKHTDIFKQQHTQTQKPNKLKPDNNTQYTKHGKNANINTKQTHKTQT